MNSFFDREVGREGHTVVVGERGEMGETASCVDEDLRQGNPRGWRRWREERGVGTGRGWERRQRRVCPQRIL